MRSILPSPLAALALITQIALPTRPTSPAFRSRQGRLLAALSLVIASGAAQATGGIPCASADGRTRLDVLVSLTNEGAGAGVTSVRLRLHGETADHAWTIKRATADYRRKTLRLSARGPAPSQPPMQLAIRQDRGSLQLGARRVKLACDWGEFS